VDIPGAIAVFLLLSALVAFGLRHAGTRRPPRPVRSRAGRADCGRSRPRRSWLVAAAQAAGVKLHSDHLGGASAELTGKAAGGLTRASGLLARRGGQRLTALSGRRWQARGDSARQPLFLTRTRNDSDSTGDSDTGESGTGGRPGTPASGQPGGHDPVPATGRPGPPAAAPHGARKTSQEIRCQAATSGGRRFARCSQAVVSS
jgi:hypothetical protein